MEKYNTFDSMPTVRTNIFGALKPLIVIRMSFVTAVLLIGR